MLRSYDTLAVAEVDTTISKRLLTALVMGWDFLPVATQGQVIRDTCRIDGDDTSFSLPEDVLAFIRRQKDRRL